MDLSSSCGRKAGVCSRLVRAFRRRCTNESQSSRTRSLLVAEFVEPSFLDPAQSHWSHAHSRITNTNSCTVTMCDGSWIWMGCCVSAGNKISPIIHGKERRPPLSLIHLGNFAPQEHCTSNPHHVQVRTCLQAILNSPRPTWETPPWQRALGSPEAHMRMVHWWVWLANLECLEEAISRPHASCAIALSPNWTCFRSSNF